MLTTTQFNASPKAIEDLHNAKRALEVVKARFAVALAKAELAVRQAELAITVES
jgi:hypothetical protein